MILFNILALIKHKTNMTHTYRNCINILFGEVE